MLTIDDGTRHRDRKVKLVLSMLGHTRDHRDIDSGFATPYKSTVVYDGGIITSVVLLNRDWV